MTKVVSSYSTTAVFLLIPNLICYLRLVILLLFVFIIGICPWLGLIFMVSTVLLDGLDGMLARKLKQTSRLGHILDYTIDRVTVVLAVYVILYYCPQFYVILCFVILLDMSSHFFHLNASHLEGKNSHKAITESMPTLLKWYYGRKAILFFTCLFHDLFWTLILADHFYPHHAWITTCIYLFCPGFVFKTIVHCVQLFVALDRTAKTDVLEKA